MRAAFALSLITAVTLTLACLVTASPLSPRSQTCANDGTTKAGTLFEHRSLSLSKISAPLQSRAIAIPCTWCLAGTATFLYIQAFTAPGPIDPPTWMIQAVLRGALEHINDLIRRQGDGLIERGTFRFVQAGMEWYSVNNNNHQQTRGVVRSAILALIDFSAANEEFGYSGFSIYDGINEVGRGVLRPVKQ